MSMSLSCLLRSALTITLVLSFSANSSMAGDPIPDYTVSRSFTEQSLCDARTSDSTTVTLTGEGTGDLAEQLTVIETLAGDVRTPSIADLEIVADQGGVVESVPARERVTVGVFDERFLIESPPDRVALGPVSDTVHNGGDSYTSIGSDGVDIWAPGDVLEYSYNQLQGDFDVSVRIDSYTHATNQGCWGKYGIMSRQTLDTNSRMCMIANHGPKGVAEGANVGNCEDDTQHTEFFGRRDHLDSTADSMFERQGHADGSPTGILPYLRLTRRGNIMNGWASADSQVENDPTNDTLWTKMVPDFDTADGGDCWFVGFGNGEHASGAPGVAEAAIQTVEFTLVKWDGTGCLQPLPEVAKRITWDVPRSTVTDGLTYSVNNPSGELITVVHDGEVVGESPVAGPPVSYTEETSTQDAGEFKSRPIGETGSGSSVFNDNTGVFTLTAGGEEMWNGGDNMNFLYKRVTGDFVATAEILFRDLQGSEWGKYGLMARQSCHPDSRHEMVAANSSNLFSAGTRHTERTDHLVPNPETNRETYVADSEVVPGSPPLDTPPTSGNPSPATNPDHMMMIRTGSQTTSYVAWDDPANPGEPYHWCLLGSTNHQDRLDDLFVGMAMNAGETADPVSTIEFTIDIQPYTVEPADPVSAVTPIFTQDFNAESDGQPPINAVLGSVNRAGGFIPSVHGGRLRMTQDGVTDSSTTSLWTDPSLEDILETGFVAEFDVTATSTGTPGAGGTFMVAGSASDQLPSFETSTPIGIFDDRRLVEHEGRPPFGLNNNTVHNGGSSYTSTTEAGRDIWAPGDTFEFAYDRVEGDFDVSVRIDDYSHSTNNGCWGKYGIMARQTLDSSSRFCMIANYGPKGVVPEATGNCDEETQVTDFFGRRNHFDQTATPNMFEGTINEEGEPGIFPYVRLVRSGNAISAWISANELVEDEPSNDSNWLEMLRSYDTTDDAPCWYLGFANSDHDSGGTAIQEVEFTVVHWDVTPATCPEITTTPFFGNAGAGLGFGGEVEPGTGNPLRERNACHPIIALEIDTEHDRPADSFHVAGVNNEGSGSPDAPGTYHIGLNTNSSTSSRQINEQLGVAASDLPDLFDSANPVHMKLEYRPNGQILAWANDTMVIDTYIPPLAFGTGLSDPIVGFTGGTGSNTQTLEFDNLTISADPPTPKGACCDAGACTDDVIQADCEAGGGTYQGDGTTCAESDDDAGVVCPVGTVFRRADCDQSGKVDFNDAIFHLRFLFLGENEEIVESCKDACDSDDSGADDFTDDINTLKVLFLGQGDIPEPGPLQDETHPCGLDPTLETPDELTCDTYTAAVDCP